MSESFRFLFCGYECHVVGNSWFQRAVYRNCLWIRRFSLETSGCLAVGKNLFLALHRGKSESYSWKSFLISCMVIQMGSLPKIWDLWLCKTEQKNDVFFPQYLIMKISKYMGKWYREHPYAQHVDSKVNIMLYHMFIQRWIFTLYLLEKLEISCLFWLLNLLIPLTKTLFLLFF